MTDLVQKVFYDSMKSAVGVVITNGLDLQTKFSVLGDNLVARNAVNGVVYALVSDGIEYASGKGSKLFNGNLNGLVDDALFLGGLSLGAEVSELDSKVADMLQKTVISDRQIINVAVEGALITGGRFLGDYIDSTPEVPQFLKTFRHPTNLITGQAYRV